MDKRTVVLGPCMMPEEETSKLLIDYIAYLQKTFGENIYFVLRLAGFKPRSSSGYNGPVIEKENGIQERAEIINYAKQKGVQIAGEIQNEQMLKDLTNLLEGNNFIPRIGSRNSLDGNTKEAIATHTYKILKKYFEEHKTIEEFPQEQIFFMHKHSLSRGSIIASTKAYLGIIQKILQKLEEQNLNFDKQKLLEYLIPKTGVILRGRDVNEQKLRNSAPRYIALYSYLIQKQLKENFGINYLPQIILDTNHKNAIGTGNEQYFIYKFYNNFYQPGFMSEMHFIPGNLKTLGKQERKQELQSNIKTQKNYLEKLNLPEEFKKQFLQRLDEQFEKIDAIQNLKELKSRSEETGNISPTDDNGEILNPEFINTLSTLKNNTEKDTLTQMRNFIDLIDREIINLLFLNQNPEKDKVEKILAVDSYYKIEGIQELNELKNSEFVNNILKTIEENFQIDTKIKEILKETLAIRFLIAKKIKEIKTQEGKTTLDTKREEIVYQKRKENFKNLNINEDENKIKIILKSILENSKKFQDNINKN